MSGARSDPQVEVAQGQRNFEEEQEKLVKPGSFPLVAPSNFDRQSGLGGNMLIDILIATPGRLVEHILHTPGFTFQHLQFLVLDEADRLLHQSFQNWTEVVMREISTPKTLNTPVDMVELIGGKKELCVIGQRHINSIFGQQKSTGRSVRKFIFSATLTHDVGKL